MPRDFWSDQFHDNIYNIISLKTVINKKVSRNKLLAQDSIDG